MLEVRKEGPQGALLAHEAEPSEAFEVQKEVLPGALKVREAGLLEAFVGPEVTELWVYTDPLVVVC